MRGPGWGRGFKRGADSGQGGFPGDPFSPSGSPPYSPPGPGAPGPAYPPPPGPFPGPVMPGQYPPPPPPGSSPWKFILIGCGILFVLAGVVTVGTCFYLAKKAPDLVNQGVSGAMSMMKSEYVKKLTGDHTDEQKERFQNLYDAVFKDEMKRLGMIKWGETYQPLIQQLDRAAADGQITVDESQQWCDDAYRALEATGYWGDDN